MNTLLELRKAIKSKKPCFLRQDSHKKKEVGEKWRKPKGIHSKMRHGFKGKRRCVAHGWGSPLEVKYLHPSGLKQVMVNTIDDLKKINAKTEGAMMASAVGLKKRLEILKNAAEQGIKILNVKNVEAYLKEHEEALKERKKKHVEITKEDKDKKEVKLEEKIEKPQSQLSDEEKKKIEKLEKNKILTKKGAM